MKMKIYFSFLRSKYIYTAKKKEIEAVRTMKMQSLCSQWPKFLSQGSHCHQFS